MAHAMLEARTEGRTYRRVEVITGHRRRRNWPVQEKARIVMESLHPATNVSKVARRNGVSRGLLTVWRRQARELGMGSPTPTAMLAAVRIASDADLPTVEVGAEYGEWNRKGAVLSDKTAQKEYRVSHDLIVKGIQAGKLEYREGAVWGNPHLRVLRNQLEAYIAEQFGSEFLARKKAKTELEAIGADSF